MGVPMFDIVKAITVIIFIVTSTVGCSNLSRIDKIKVGGDYRRNIKQTSLRENISIKDVTGGKVVNPLLTLTPFLVGVDSFSFKAALKQSLESNGLYAKNHLGKYQLVAHIEELSRPASEMFLRFSITIIARVNYSVYVKETGKSIYNRTIESTHKESFVSDNILSLDGARLANEGAIHENIRQMIDSLFMLKV